MTVRNVCRQPPTSTDTSDYPGCSAVPLPRMGTLTINHTQELNLSEANSVVYQATCLEGGLPTVLNRGETILQLLGYASRERYNTTNDLNLLDYPSLSTRHHDISEKHEVWDIAPVNLTSWASSFSGVGGRYNNTPQFEEGVVPPNQFYMSTFPPLVTLAGGCVLMYVCFVSLLCSRRPYLLQLAALVSVTCFTITAGVFLHKLDNQYAMGYTDCQAVVEAIAANTLASVASLILRAGLMFCEILTVMHLFKRKRERRVIGFAGGLFLCTSEILWGISLFTSLSPDQRGAALDAVIVFAYLFSIATDVLFVCAIILYTSWSWRVAYKPRLLLIAFFTHMATMVPIILFIVDLADQYVDSWNNYAKEAGMMTGIVCMWIWTDRMDQIERIAEAHSVLGRQQCAEDEDLLFEEEEKKFRDDFEFDISPSKSSKSGLSKSRSRGHRYENRSHESSSSAQETSSPDSTDQSNGSSGDGVQPWVLSDLVESGLAKMKIRPPSRARQVWHNILDKTPFTRPQTSSSTQTTYDVTYEPEPPEPALTVHQHPFKRRSP